MTRFKLGDKVKVVGCSGLDSDKEGILITYQEYIKLGGDSEDFLVKRWGRFSTKLAYLKTDSQPISMFKSRLIKIG